MITTGYAFERANNSLHNGHYATTGSSMVVFNQFCLIENENHSHLEFGRKKSHPFEWLLVYLENRLFQFPASTV